jgi:hyperosmotically inducible protein
MRKALVLMVLVAGLLGAAQTGMSEKGRARIVKEVRHALVMLPYYSVFDNLEYSVGDGVVTLAGQVTRPTLKKDAESDVKAIEGVERVVNNIEVLPPAPNDDRIRRAVFQAIYGHSALNRYAILAVPSIHIVVKAGHVTLEGVADREGDRNIAGMQANSVPGVFSVTNHLRVEK